MALAEEDEVPEAFVLDGFDEALGVRMAVWALGRNLHAPDTLRALVVLGPLAALSAAFDSHRSPTHSTRSESVD